MFYAYFAQVVLKVEIIVFSKCGFCSSIWKARMLRYIMSSPPSSLQDVIGVGCRKSKLKSMVDVYNLWCAINEIKHSGQPKPDEHILKMIDFWGSLFQNFRKRKIQEV
jgi:hypothetical protein